MPTLLFARLFQEEKTDKGKTVYSRLITTAKSHIIGEKYSVKFASVEYLRYFCGTEVSIMTNRFDILDNLKQRGHGSAFFMRRRRYDSCIG